MAIDKKVQQDRLEKLFAEVITTLGYDVTEPGLVDTPRRMANAYLEMLVYEDDNIDTTFEAVETDQMVIVSGVKEFSNCEHHLLPFKVEVAVGYIVGDRVIGLSKIPRIIRKHCRKLQLQERLGEDIARELTEVVKPLGVIVVIKGEHTCMQMRGVRSEGTMTTSYLSGVFKYNSEPRQEFFNLLRI